MTTVAEMTKMILAMTTMAQALDQKARQNQRETVRKILQELASSEPRRRYHAVGPHDERLALRVLRNGEKTDGPPAHGSSRFKQTHDNVGVRKDACASHPSSAPQAFPQKRRLRADTSAQMAAQVPSYVPPRDPIHICTYICILSAYACV